MTVEQLIENHNKHWGHDDGLLDPNCSACRHAAQFPCPWCGYGAMFPTHNLLAHSENGDTWGDNDWTEALSVLPYEEWR